MPNTLIKRIARGAVISLLIALIPMSLFTVAPLFGGTYPTAEILVQGGAASLIFGVAIYFVGLFTRRLQKYVGTTTGLAALAGICAIVGTALALVLPSCPGSITGEACTTSEGATWGFSLAMLVILFTIFRAIVTGSIDFTKWAGGKFAAAVKPSDKEETATEAEEEQKAHPAAALAVA